MKHMKALDKKHNLTQLNVYRSEITMDESVSTPMYETSGEMSCEIASAIRIGAENYLKFSSVLLTP